MSNNNKNNALVVQHPGHMLLRKREQKLRIHQAQDALLAIKTSDPSIHRQKTRKNTHSSSKGVGGRERTPCGREGSSPADLPSAVAGDWTGVGEFDRRRRGIRLAAAHWTVCNGRKRE